MRRIKRNDIAIIPYTKTSTKDPEGFNVDTWVAGTTFYADVQPVGTREGQFIERGIDLSEPDSRIVYSDFGTLIEGGYYYAGGKPYVCSGVSEWYGHDEGAFVPYRKGFS